MLGSIIKKERLAQNMSQDALAEGICAVSYLSKIENQKIEASDEIYKLLFDALALSYVSDNKALETFRTKFNVFQESVYKLEAVDELFYEDAKNFINSKYHVQALLICLYFNDIDALQSLLDVEPLLNSEQQLLYYIVLGIHYLYHENNNYKAKEFFSKCLYQDVYGVAYYYLSNANFLMGNFNESILEADTAYQHFSNHGSVGGMLEASHLKMMSYSNNNQLVEMEKESFIAIELNSYVRNRHLQYMIDYNLGATYLMNHQLEKAQEHLLEAYKLSYYHHQDNVTMIQQKLLFLYILMDNRDAAKRIYTRIDKQGDVTYLRSLSVIKYMIEHHEYISHPHYQELLESCLYSAKDTNHYGYELFYAKLLLDSYKASYKYKQALEISEIYKL